MRRIAINRFAPYALGLILIAAAFLWFIPRSPRPDLAVPDDLALEESPRTYTKVDTIRRGDTLGHLLQRNRLGMIAIDRVIREIRAHDYFSLRSLRPGQTVEFTRDEAGQLLRLVCRLSPEEIFVFQMDADPDSIRSFAQEVEKVVRVRKIAGTVRSTFEEAIRSAGGDSRLAIRVSDIVAGDIDFFTDVRRGDTFKILVEERFADGEFIGFGEILYGTYEGEQAKAECIYYRPNSGKSGHYDMKGGSLKRAFLKSPLNYARISSHFSNRRLHPILRTYRPHHGVDYAAPTGTPVVTVADGVVQYAGWKSGLGKTVEIKHSATHVTRYGHLNGYAKGVQRGARVRQGEKIGYVGATGLATGPHLHYEMRVGGRPTNPLTIKMVPAEPIPHGELATFRAAAQELLAMERAMADGDRFDRETWRDRFLAQHVNGPDASRTD